MAKQLTAPGCIYTIVARVDTTIYSPDQNWVLDVPAGQHDFIAETNEVIIPGDAMMRRKTRQHAKDRNRINLLGIGPGSLVSFITRAIERIVGKGNVTVTYEDGKMTVVLAASVTYAQVAMVESLLDRMLPKDVVEEISDAPIGYTRLEFLKSDGKQSIETFVPVDSIDEIGVTYGNGTGAMFESAASLANALLFYADGDYAFRLDYGGAFAARLAVPSGKKQILFSLEKSQIDINGSVRSVEKKADFTLQPYQFWFSERYKVPVHSYKGKLYEAKIIKNNTKRLWLIPTLDPAGKPCMFDIVTRKPFYNTATTGSDFIAGMTTDQALNLENLPVTGDGALTVSLPWEDQWDTGVQNALDTASTNGWTITVQYRDPDVGTENIPISFLESTGTQYIDTGIKLSNESEVRCDAMITQARPEGNAQAFFGVFGTPTYRGYLLPTNGLRINAGERNDVIASFNDISYEQNLRIRVTKTKTILNNSQSATYELAPFETSYTCYVYAANTLSPNYWSYARVYAFSIARNNRSQLNFIPALDRTGRPCMFDAVTGKLFYNAATTGPDFIAGLTWEQVRKLQLPTTGGQLTLSLPYEASIDGISQTALDQARANGWELTLQYDEAEVPEGYSKLDFLESTGTQYIDTGLKLSNESEVVCSYYVDENVQGNGYLFGATALSEDSNGPHFKFLASSEARPAMVYAFMGISHGSALPRPDGLALVTLNSVTCKCNENSVFFKDIPSFETNGSCVLYRMRSQSGNVDGSMSIKTARIYFFNISRNNSLQLAYIPCLDQAGVPCMFDLVSHQSFYNKGAGQFTAGMTWEQARKLHLPAPGGKLTLSLPYEASIDSLTQAALEQARVNGWELTLQYADVELPVGYSKLDFLESTGDQYIDTGIVVTNDLEIRGEFQRTQTEYTRASFIFGAKKADSYFSGLFLSHPLNYLTHYGLVWGSTQLAGHLEDDHIRKISFSAQKDKLQFDSNEVTINGETSLDYPMLLFAVNNSGNAAGKAFTRIYTFYINRNNALQLAFIPCLDPDGTPCMYDLVSHQPFRNDGTGQFIAGMTLEQVCDLSLPAGGGQLTLALPYEASLDGLAQDALERARVNGWVLTLQYDEVVVPAGYSKVDYLESTGVQYIDTEWLPDIAAKILVEYEPVKISSTSAILGNHGASSTRLLARISPNTGQPETVFQFFSKEKSAPLEVNKRYTAELYEKTAILNGELFSLEEKTTTSNVSLKLFGQSEIFLGFCKIYSFSINRNSALHLAYIPCLDPEGVPCMYDLVSQQAFRNSGTGQFVVGMTMKQALALANLPAPTTSNTLTISLPKEASLVLYNQDVEAALEQARANGWDIAVQYRDEFEDEAILNKYAECTTIAEMEAVNPDYKNDLTSDGIWVYPIPAFRDANNLFRGAVNMKGFDIDISHLTNIDAMFALTGLEGEVVLEHPTITVALDTLAGSNSLAVYSKVRLNLPEATDIRSICYHNRYLREVSGNLDKVETADQAFFGRYGAETDSILDFKAPLPALSSGSGMFNRQGLTKESVLLICNSIPSYTSGSHLLTLGIHKDYKNDPEVNLALKKVDINYEPTVELSEEVTTGKGWTLTVQWNGMANGTTATFDRGTIIYAKVGEMEHPDGTTEQFLDWGHYVTNWEERGYEQFRSLESAYEYFGLEQETNEQSNT